MNKFTTLFAIAIAVATIFSLGMGLEIVLDAGERITYNPVEETQVVLGHRIGSNGQFMLVTK